MHIGRGRFDKCIILLIVQLSDKCLGCHQNSKQASDQAKYWPWLDAAGDRLVICCHHWDVLCNHTTTEDINHDDVRSATEDIHPTTEDVHATMEDVHSTTEDIHATTDDFIQPQKTFHLTKEECSCNHGWHSYNHRRHSGWRVYKRQDQGTNGWFTVTKSYDSTFAYRLLQVRSQWAVGRPLCQTDTQADVTIYLTDWQWYWLWRGYAHRLRICMAVCNHSKQLTK